MHERIAVAGWAGSGRSWLSICCRVGCPLLLALTSCEHRADSGTGSWEGAVDTLANSAVVVTNSSAGVWPSSGSWTLEEDPRIGSSEGEGPEGFARIAAIAVDRHGRIHALENRARELRSFDAEGEHVRTVGGFGQGPGEFGNPWGIVFGSDGSVWVVDPGNARYTRFDSTGTLSDEFRRPVSFFSIPWPGGVDGAGRIYDVGVVSTTREPGGSQVLVEFTPGIGATDTLRLPEFETDPILVTRSDGTPVMSLLDPFAARLLWRFDPRGYVWSVTTDEYRIVQRTLAGDTVRIIRREVARVPVDQAARDSALAATREVIASAGPGARAGREPRVPRFRPVLRTIHVDPDGYLWVELEPGPGEARRMEVFGEDRRLLGHVELPASFRTQNPLPVFRDGYTYGVSTDELDVPYLVRLSIQGRR